ncbi:MAG: hypothetical protein AB7F21_12560 [Desulfuromonadales bacterium]
MSQITRVKTAQEFYEFWHARLSVRQAESLSNVKKACDTMVGMAAQVKMTPASIGKYCSETLNCPPSEQTIRNMKIADDSNNKVGVYLEYIRLRASEFNRKRKPKSNEKEKPKSPSYFELAENIADPDTRTWVKNLVRELNLVEGSCNFLEKQVRQMSKEVGGLDIAGAIEAGPTVENPMNLPVMSTNTPKSQFPFDFIDAIKAIHQVPENDDLPYLQINDKGALVFDDGYSGAVIVLNPKQWQTIVEIAKEGM